MATINKQTRDKIVAQSLNELQFARTFKQGKTRNWKINEEMYYGKKIPVDSSRTNVDLGKMGGFVHTILSKIDNPLTFKFIKRKDSQLQRVSRLNALRQIDQQNNNWDIKDIVGKKQAVIYGRTIYSYYADSVNGYESHLENVDVYDFLIDPSAGGIDIELAMYMGRYGVVKTKSQIKQGIKDGFYLKYEANELIQGSGNADESTQEKTNQMSRTYDQNLTSAKKEMGNTDKYKFWEWYTTYEGDRYYVLMTSGGACIRCELLIELFESDTFPFWTWASFPDLTEFWTPSYCDYVREIFMAQSVSINQMLDNAEQINKPQKIVNVGAIENLTELKYRKDGYIKVKKDFDVQKALQTLQTPSIDTPLRVYDTLEMIQQSESGVTAGERGVSDTQGKVGIYEGNKASAADRFGLLNKSYTFGYKRFAALYEHGVREHLLKKTAVDILGPDGVEIQMVSRKDIFWKGDKFGIMVESSNAELALSEDEKKQKIMFLNNNSRNPTINQKKSFELQASIVGLEEGEVRQLLDTSDYGDEELMSEAERDIELILDGQKIKPNSAATTAYKQRFVDYMQDNEEDISEEQFKVMVEYVFSLDQVIARNMARLFQQKKMQMMMQGATAPPSDTPPQTPTEQLQTQQ